MDLHDELGQSLTAISVDGTALLEMSRTNFPKAQASAQAIVDITHHVIRQIHVMLQRLRPEVLDGLGLKAALGEMLTAWQKRNHGVSCRSAEHTSELQSLMRISYAVLCL